MINRGTKDLYRQLDEAQKMIRGAKNIDERVALANYIGNIYRALICMGDGNVTFDRKKCFGKYGNYKKFIKKLDIYSDKMIRGFVNSKAFHKSFFGEVIPLVEDEMAKFCTLNFDGDDTFSENDFLEVFSEFMKSLSLGDLFDEFYKSGKIYSSIVGSDKGNLGFTLHNPVNARTDLFIKDLKYDLGSMNTLAHEFGHAYDLSLLDDNVFKYNQYFYVSFYGEVMSRLFERLLFRFLLKNGVKEDVVRDKIIDFEVINFDFLLDAYILSLLDDEMFASDEYIDCDSDTIYKKVKAFFLEESDIKGVIERMQEVDLSEVFNYAYGDIISLFLCDEYEKFGLSSDVMEYFLHERGKLFSEDFLRECGFGPMNYAKLYTKEVQLIKK